MHSHSWKYVFKMMPYSGDAEEHARELLSQVISRAEAMKREMHALRERQQQQQSYIYDEAADQHQHQYKQSRDSSTTTTSTRQRNGQRQQSQSYYEPADKQASGSSTTTTSRKTTGHRAPTVSITTAAARSPPSPAPHLRPTNTISPLTQRQQQRGATLRDLRARVQSLLLDDDDANDKDKDEVVYIEEPQEAQHAHTHTHYPLSPRARSPSPSLSPPRASFSSPTHPLSSSSFLLEQALAGKRRQVKEHAHTHTSTNTKQQLASSTASASSSAASNFQQSMASTHHDAWVFPPPSMVQEMKTIKKKTKAATGASRKGKAKTTTKETTTVEGTL